MKVFGFKGRILTQRRKDAEKILTPVRHSLWRRGDSGLALCIKRQSKSTWRSHQLQSSGHQPWFGRRWPWSWAEFFTSWSRCLYQNRLGNHKRSRFKPYQRL